MRIDKCEYINEIIKSLKEVIHHDSLAIEKLKRSIKNRKKTIRIYEAKVREAENEH